MSSKRSPVKSAALLAAVLLALFLFLPARVAHAIQGVPDNINGNNWMSGLSDDIPLSDLSIPGAHDAGTMYTSLGGVHAECQDTYIGPFDGGREGYFGGLLERGIRHFDVRLEWDDDDNALVLCHNIFNCQLVSSTKGSYFEPPIYTYTTLTADKAFDWFETFLREHPTETLIVEFTSETDDKNIPIIHDYMHNLAHKQDSLVWSGNHMPTLGEVRGKMVLFSHGVYSQADYVEAGGGYWALAVAWQRGDADNKRAALSVSMPDYEIWSQNMWDEVSYGRKWDYVFNSLGRLDGASASQAETVLAENAAKGKRTWFVSYASANDGAKRWPPEYANVVNPGIRDKIAYEGSDAFCGILAMDFPKESEGFDSSDVTKHVWATNYNRWTTTTYEWSKDYSTCTAKRAKMSDASVVETVTEKTTPENVRNATCTQAGTRRYHAFFLNTPWAYEQKIDVETPALGHQWTSEPVQGSDSCVHVWCERSGCDYGKDKGFYMQLSAPANAQYDGAAHEAEVSCRMPDDMQKLLKLEYFGEDDAKLGGPPVYAGTYKAVLTLADEQVECTYTISKCPVNVVALNQIVSMDLPDIVEDPESGDVYKYATLQSCGDVPLVDGDVLDGVHLKQDASSEASGTITPSSAHISHNGEDATGSYKIEPENYVKGTWLKVDHGKPIFTPPTAYLGMTYNGESKLLVEGGSVPDGYGYEMQYALSDGNVAPTVGWDTKVPERKDAGTYSVWYRLKGTNTDNIDDIIGPLRTFATISPKPVDLIWNFGSDEFEYDGQGHIPGAEATNVVAGDSLTVNVTAHQALEMQGESLVSAGQDGPRKVGNYVAEATGLSGQGAGNYCIQRQAALHNFRIVPRKVSIDGKVAQDKVYDGTCEVELDLTKASFPQLVGGDDLYLASCTASFADANTGTDKQVLIESARLGGKDAFEYVLNSDSLTLAANIKQREVKLYWGRTDFYYDGQAHVPVPEVGGLVGADWCSAIMSGEAVDVGTHTATAVGLDNPNYCLASDVPQSFVIRLSDIDAPYQVVLENGSPELTSTNLGTVANEQTTDEERGSYTYGTPLMVTLTSKGVEESAVPKADASSAKDLLTAQGLTAGQWLDISLTKQFVENTTAITSTKTPVQMEVAVPEGLQAAGRTFSLIRCHDGKAEKIAESSDTTFKTETDEFSSYLIAYRDESTSQPKQETKQGSTQSATQQAATQQAARSNLATTGDTANATGLAVFLAVAALALAASGLALRRKER